jgi:hypothetical protein
MKSNILRHGNRFSKFYSAIFILLIAAVGYTILYQGRAAQDTTPPAVYLLPDVARYPANTQFTVPIRANSGTTAVNAVLAEFTYPTNLVDFVSLDTSASPYKICATTTTLTGTAPTTEQCGVTQAANGSIYIERGLDLGATPVVGDQLIATATFKTKTTSGTGSFTLTDKTLLIRSDNFTNIVGASSAKRGMQLTVDTAAPSVVVTNPSAGLAISRGSTVPINVSVTDASPINKVDILIDGVVKTTLPAAPYTYSWDTTGLTLGAHTIQAKAIDAVNLPGQSSVISVNLVDNTKPSVSLTAPATGSSVAGTITVSATASDGANGTGISKVEFYEGTNNLIGTDATSPYSISWNTNNVADGTRSITARAYDGANPVNVQTSTAVTVSVANADTTPPSALLGLQTTATTTNSISLKWNASNDDRGAVAGYRISRAGVNPVTVTGTTYTATGLTASTSYTFTVVALDQAGNPSQPGTITASTQAPKVGDFDNSNDVDPKDLALLLGGWGSTDAKLDLNKNGKVDLYDLSIFLTNYGK